MKRNLIRDFGAQPESIALISFVGLFIYFSFALGPIWYGNLPSLLRDVSWLGLVAIGQAFVMIAGEFDISVGSVFALTGLIYVLMMHLGFSPELAILIALASSLLIGYINGVMTWRLRLPSLLVTLGFLFVYRGIIYFLTKGDTIAIPSNWTESTLVDLLGGLSGGYHNAILIGGVIMVASTYMLVRTRLGNHIQAVGGDLASAGACGIRIDRIKITAFMICSGLAGLAGVVATSTLTSVSPTTADGMEFEAVAACVIGGCSMRGGVGSPWGAIAGVATLMALKSGLILLGINIFTYQLLLGGVLVSLIAIRGLFPHFFAVR